nr:uncharacterized protein LOC105875503 isoform X2 [Microcebus murinus]
MVRRAKGFLKSTKSTILEWFPGKQCGYRQGQACLGTRGSGETGTQLSRKKKLSHSRENLKPESPADKSDSGSGQEQWQRQQQEMTFEWSLKIWKEARERGSVCRRPGDGNRDSSGISGVQRQDVTAEQPGRRIRAISRWRNMPWRRPGLLTILPDHKKKKKNHLKLLGLQSLGD